MHTFLDGRDVLRVVPWPAVGTNLQWTSAATSQMCNRVSGSRCLSGFIFGGLSRTAYITTCMGALAKFSKKDSFVNGRL